MDSISLKQNTTTKLTIKKATFDKGQVIVDGEPIDLLNILEKHFSSCVFDLTVTEKAEEELDIEGIDVVDLEDEEGF